MGYHFGERDTFVQLKPNTRDRIAEAIEGLLALLDQFDGDPDFEDGFDDESYISGSMFDREGDLADWEPSLGWISRDEKGWTVTHGSDADLEVDHQTAE